MHHTDNMIAISPRLGSAFGILAAVVFVILYSVAAFSDNGYTFGENYLSDLGVGPAAWAFNSAVVLAGTLMILFAHFGLRQLIGKDWVSRTGILMLEVCGILLAGIGVFTEDAEPYHLILSVSFFLCFLATSCVLSVVFYRTRSLGRLAFVVTAVFAVVGFAILPMGSDPLSETIAVLLIITWGTIIAGAGLAAGAKTSPE